MKEQHSSTASSPVAKRTDAARIYIDTQIVEQRGNGTLQDGRCGYDREILKRPKKWSPLPAKSQH